MIDFNDPVLRFGDGNMFSRSAGYDSGKPTALIYASCHGRPLFGYITRHRPDFASKYNLLRLETAPMVIYSAERSNVFENKTILNVFGEADVLITYSMGARHGECSLESVKQYLKKDVQIVTFVAPNFSCVWPMAHGYGGGLAVLTALDNGEEEEGIWDDYVTGKFDPMFNVRWRIEMSRLQDKEGYHDVGLAEFVEEHIKVAKLFLAGGHPSMTTMAHLGNEILAVLGFDRESCDKILSYNYLEASPGMQPETDYEFKHYGFTYPMRHRDELGGVAFYRKFLSEIVKAWEQKGNTKQFFAQYD